MTDAKKVLMSIEKRGVWGTLKLSKKVGMEMIRWYLDSWYDKQHHVDTSGMLSLTSLGITSESLTHATWYEPVPSSCFRELLTALEIDFTKYLFIDFGSGKGRVLFLATEYPFKRIVGVEFSPILHAIALRNIHSFRSRHQLCNQIESLCIDAIDYDLPPVPSVLFFYSPFNAPILGKVLDNIRSSLMTTPRELFILYIGTITENIKLLRNTDLEFREINLRPAYLRRERKRGFILKNVTQ